jgi:hypothetical protein
VLVFTAFILPGFIAWKIGQLRLPQGEQKPQDVAANEMDRLAGGWRTSDRTFHHGVCFARRAFVRAMDGQTGLYVPIKDVLTMEVLEASEIIDDTRKAKVERNES